MPIRISTKRLIEKVAQQKIQQVIEENGGVVGGGGSGTSITEVVTVNTYEDLLALADKREGVIYITKDEDFQYVYDEPTHSFISHVKELDGGVF